MFALNFQSPHHEELLISRKKNVTIRLGDITDKYAESSVVWITVGKKYAPKKKLYSAMVDKVYVKQFSELTAYDLDHQNPGIKTVDELINFFSTIYEKTLGLEDIVTVIYFSEIVED